MNLSPLAKKSWWNLKAPGPLLERILPEFCLTKFFLLLGLELQYYLLFTLASAMCWNDTVKTEISTSA